MSLNKLPSYSGLNFIMSEYMNNKQNPISSEEQYEDIDINLLLEDEFDINNSILTDEPMEIAQEQEYLDKRMAEEFETLAKIEKDFENDL